MPKKEQEPRAPPPGVQWWCYHSHCKCSFESRDALLKHNTSVHGRLKFRELNFLHFFINSYESSRYFFSFFVCKEPASVFAQLSLKEGLTVFRDPVYIFSMEAVEFSSDVGSSTVKRIADVLKLRIYQYPQDAGPMAHPIRPHSYIKMDNFYTGKLRFH
ncbi:unnamed protein product [Coffea canephora]|uniref:DH200=94 genomic scaffold, scaffold_867 n=1 Tax=Coffea canephora TaxID=49390 RepID=A0A068VH77_COFCA|nr:unnamed protein product [Coffea canephora]